MQACGARTHAGTAGLEHDHRLFLRHAFCDFGKGASVLQILAVLRDDRRVVVLLEECQQIVFVDVRFVASPTIAETPILAERENPMIAMPMPPDCDDSAAWPLTS